MEELKFQLNTRKSNKAFTLVELVAVAIILLILAIVSFISINNYAATTRDAKRLNDITELFNKIDWEKENGLNLESLIVNPISSEIRIGGIPQNVTIGTINFQVLRESALSFKPSRENEVYEIAISRGSFMGEDGEEVGFEFIQLRAINERDGGYQIVGNYRRIIKPGDSVNLFTSADGVEINECYMANGVGEQVGDGPCEVKSCNAGYVPSGNSCELEQCTGNIPTNATSTAISQNITTPWNYNSTPGVCTYTCDEGYHTEDSGVSCISNTEPCDSLPQNATAGTQTWNGTSWGTCVVTSCNSGYVVSEGVCKLEQCTGSIPTNATSTATSQSTTTSWNYNSTPGVCTYTCDEGYHHTEDSGASCISNTNPCDSLPQNATAGTQTWNGTSWGACVITSCGIGFVVSGNTCEALGWFTTTWRVGTSGYGDGSNIVQFSVTGSGTMNILVDWGDGTIESKSASTTLLSHTYTTAGDKEVKVQNITRFYANNIDFHGKLIFVNDWGNIQWLDMKDMFFGADHLISLPNSVPNMSKVKDMSFMFVNAKVFNQDISSWDVSNVINMNSMFNNTLSFNNGCAPNIYNCLLSWNVSSVTNMGSMFRSSGFNQDISSWDVSSVTSMNDMFSGISGTMYSSIGTISLDKISEFNNGNQPLSWGIKTRNVKSMFGMFNTNLVFNQDISSWNVSSVTNMGNMFSIWQGTSLFNQNINSWCVPLISSKPYSFDEGSNAGFINNTAKQPQWGVSCP